MSISLLHPARAGARPLPIGERVCYQLSLDRAFEYICADVKKREIFFSVLRELSCDPETIRYRQAVLQDLLEDPSLAEQLSPMLARFDSLRDSQEQTAREEARLTTMEGRESELRARSGPPVCLSFPFLHHAGLPQTPTSFEGEGKGVSHKPGTLLWDLAEK